LHNIKRNQEDVMHKTKEGLIPNVADNLDALQKLIVTYVSSWGENRPCRVELYLSVGDYANAKRHSIMDIEQALAETNPDIYIDIHA
jgi:predicted RNA-binding protein Jag